MGAGGLRIARARACSPLVIRAFGVFLNFQSGLLSGIGPMKI